MKVRTLRMGADVVSGYPGGRGLVMELVCAAQRVESHRTAHRDQRCPPSSSEARAYGALGNTGESRALFCEANGLTKRTASRTRPPCKSSVRRWHKPTRRAVAHKRASQKE